MEKVVETKQCKQCSCNFNITDKDLEFYNRISPIFNTVKQSIPTPNLCFTCRQQRRLAWRNERNLYNRRCDSCKSNIISIYTSDADYKVFCNKCWWDDRWNALDYGKTYDFNKSFFQQFDELLHSIPQMNLLSWQSENCEFSNYIDHCNNCYLVFGGSDSKESYYSDDIGSGNNFVDCIGCRNSELCYDSVDLNKCYNIISSIECSNSSNLIFCYDCNNCSDCIFSFNLNQKKYHIFNQEYSKEEYLKEKEKLNLNIYNEYLHNKERFLNLKKEKAIRKYANIINSENCSGNNIANSKESQSIFDSTNLQDSKYIESSTNSHDIYDIFGSSSKGCELSCEGVCIEGNNIISGFYIAGGYNIYYSQFVIACNNIFGCIGLKHNEYCILNKQYTKEEYEDILPKIIEQMKKNGEWGEFFPISISPFGYNETVSQEFFPLSKESIISRDYKWQDKKEKEYTKQTYIIPENIQDLTDDICNHMLSCEITGKNYKIIKQELEFYKKMNLPIPRRCPNQRHLERIKLKSPHMTWDKKCSKCSIDINTVYSSDELGKVYCEKCYLDLMY